MITHAKKGSLHNRREVLKKIRDKDVVHTLFAEIGPFFADRAGGYTRIIKVEARKGDNAPMAVIELVREKTVTSEADRARRSRVGGDTASGGRTSQKAEPVAEEVVAEETPVADEVATDDVVAEETPVAEETAVAEEAGADAADDTASDSEVDAEDDSKS